MEFDDVGVVGLPQDFYLPVGTLSISGVLESIKYFFEGVDLLIEAILHFPNMTIGSWSDFLEYVEPPEDMALYMTVLSLIHYKFIIIPIILVAAYNLRKEQLLKRPTQQFKTDESVVKN